MSLFSLPSRQTRKDFITAKYTEKRFVRRLCADGDSRLQRLYEAVRNRDILSLIQVYAEGAELMEPHPQPNEHVSTYASHPITESSPGAGWSCDSKTATCVRQEPGETVLHLAVRMGDRNSLHIVDFLAQNRYGTAT